MSPSPTPSPTPVVGWRLAPGVRVVDRGLEHVQVGGRPGCRLVLPRTAAVRAALSALDQHQPPTSVDAEAAAVLDRLAAAGCVEGRAAASERARRRAGARVVLLGSVPGLDLATAVAATGLAPATRPRDRAPGAHRIGLAVTLGECDRDLLDPWVRDDVPHVVVRLLDGGAVLGPFVSPGSTPCLRCLDGHLGRADRDHVAVTARYVRASRRARSDGLPDLPDRALAAHALAWAARDLAAYAEGRTPSTWSRTIELGTDPGDQVQTVWTRHPECGCSWPADLAPSGMI